MKHYFVKQPVPAYARLHFKLFFLQSVKNVFRREYPSHFIYVNGYWRFFPGDKAAIERRWLHHHLAQILRSTLISIATGLKKKFSNWNDLHCYLVLN